MADENKTTFKLDLDASDMVDGLSTIKNQLGGLSDPSNLAGLVEGLKGAGAAVGAIGVAAIAARSAFEAVFAAEKIEQTSAQFTNLGKNAGLATNALREGLIKAAGGLATENELLEAGNKAIVELGANAEKLPEIMELARKYTAAFGGDLITNFENINRAIATGSQRLLKQMGIQVDVNKAYQDYSKQINVAVGALSQQEKQAAVLNAVLEKGKSSLAGVSENMTSATTISRQFIITMKEIGEVIDIAFNKIAGPAVRQFLGGLSLLSGELKTFLVAHFGEGVDQAKAKSKELEGSYTELSVKLAELNQNGRTFFEGTWVEKGTKLGDAAASQIKARMAQIGEEIKKTDAQLTQVEEKAKEADAKSRAGRPAGGDLEKQQELHSKFEADLMKLRDARLQKEIKDSQSETEITAIETEKKLTIEKEFQARIEELKKNQNLTETERNQMASEMLKARAQEEKAVDEETLKRKAALLSEKERLTGDEEEFDRLRDTERNNMDEEHAMRVREINQNELLDAKQKSEALLEEQQMYNLRLQQFDVQTETERERVLDRWVQYSNNAAEQFGRAFERQSMRARQRLTDFASQGDMAFKTFSKHTEDAFIKMGEGAQKGSDIMRGALLGMVADIAEAYGRMALEAGLIPPNPVYLAAGAALLALSGYLRSQSKGSSAGIGDVGGGGGGGGYAAGGTDMSTQPTSAVQQQQTQAKQVNINIAGNYFETDQTRTRMLEMIRDASDATDYKYEKIGGGT